MSHDKCTRELNVHADDHFSLNGLKRILWLIIVLEAAFNGNHLQKNIRDTYMLTQQLSMYSAIKRLGGVEERYRDCLYMCLAILLRVLIE